MDCPICFSSRIHKDGISKAGKQKYYCLHCGRYFSGDSFTPKRIVVISDTHCGHLWGLTPPLYWTQYDEDAYNFQRESWTWYTNTISLLKPFDMVIANGDLIDGRGEKSGGTELLVTDRMKQAEMAAEVINTMDATDVLMTRGTEYHVGNIEQFEDNIAKLVDAREIGDKLRFKVNGNLFDVRHHVGRTTVPWSELTAALKELILANLEKEENINMLIRSHVHKYIYGSIDTNQSAITTPGLEGHSRFGSRRCTGRTDFGVVVIDISNKGEIICKPIIANLESLKVKIRDY